MTCVLSVLVSSPVHSLISELILGTTQLFEVSCLNTAVSTGSSDDLYSSLLYDFTSPETT